jgi:hypothetical protein
MIEAKYDSGALPPGIAAVVRRLQAKIAKMKSAAVADQAIDTSIA